MNKPFKPTRQQTEAANPSQSVWVTANAGSGKTHVLVERVIRLLLDGAEPSTILCITFTKAAAAEMSSRLFERLSRWTAFDNEALKAELQALGIDQPASAQLIRARRLFTAVLETPGGLKIQTIHAFCERLLQLFPVEAGMAPGFRVLDDRQARQMRNESKREILRQAALGDAENLANAFRIVVANSTSETFDSLIQSFLSSSQNLRSLLEAGIDDGDFILLLKNLAGVDLNETTATIALKLNQIDRDAYLLHADILGQHKPFGGHDASTSMKLVTSVIEKSQLLKHIYFTRAQPLALRKKLMANDVAIAHQNTQEFIAGEQARLLFLFNQQDMLKRIEATSAIFTLAKAINVRIERQKRQLGCYDFDDLIKRTSLLLQNARAAQWVLYKLDSGLNHILLDEAQDTSPAQWQIIQALAQEFFAGQGRSQSKARTLFVVGDRKQSIYSFQGADAATFAAARSQFISFISNNGNSAGEVELNISYRSTEDVLSAVNHVFPANNPQRFGFAAEDKAEQDHTTNRIGAPGRVEVWPLVFPAEAEETEDHWAAPVDREPAQSSKRRLARQIASTIKAWIGKRRLESQNRLIEPGDIMILLQSRGSLFSMLIAEMRKIGVPVAGADRLKLSESIAIQDLLLLVQWLHLPDDDYALACILKSPFVPMPLNEDELFQLAHGRASHSMWSRLQTQKSQNAIWLSELKTLAAKSGPFDFFAKLMVKFRKPMLRRLGPEAGDAVDAFLDQALAYEIEHGQSMAGFLHWFNAGETQIRRELEKSSGEVRLMTVHGAKGLEANIVFLPDAASVPKGRDAQRLLIIPDRAKGTGLPLWMLSGLSISPELQVWLDETKAKEVAERNRLLYVAMTRARDELYICGAAAKQREIPKESWYAIVEPILGTTRRLEEDDQIENDPATIAKPDAEIPAWALSLAPDEIFNDVKSATGVTSGYQHLSTNSQSEDFQRGTAIHRFLQDIPNIAPENQRSFALRQAKRFNLTEQEALSLVALTNSPLLAPFLGANSAAEVEISGQLENGQFIIGRIDRMVKNQTEILLLDYKSDRFVPESSGIDHSYVRQLSIYAGLLGAAYPDHIIKAALLWTQGPKLEWISSDILARAREKT